MTIKIQTTTVQETEIPIPSFWKSGYSEHFRAVLNESTFASVYKGDKHSALVIGNPTFYQDQITDCLQSWALATEEEFMEAYNKAYNSFNLQPVLTNNNDEN